MTEVIQYNYHADRPADVPGCTWKHERYLLDPSPRPRCDPPEESEFGYRWALYKEESEQ